MKKTTPILIRFLAILMTVVLLATNVSAYDIVRKGSSGSDVRTLQTMLNAVQKADLTVDGVFGSATLTAVKDYQKHKGLDVDGIVGEKTWTALERDYNEISNSKTSSTLKIGSGKYAPGTLKKGSSYSFSGKISSNFKITSVTVGVYKSDGTKVQTKSAKPNAKSYDISKLDSYIIFGQLETGSYLFKVTAKDASGKSKTLVKNEFKVSAPVASTLKIASGKYDPGTLKKGSAYSISGKISSNYKITSVTVGIYKSDGTKVQTKSSKPNAKSYDISKLDSYIIFGQLETGSYLFKVTAKDASGKSKTLVKNEFKVSAPAASTLKIGSGKYAPGTLTEGDTYSVSGNISSNYKITSVTVGVYKKDGTKVQTKSAKPNAKSYDIKKLDSSIKFGNLSIGSYVFMVTAKDASGKSKTLVKNNFKVKDWYVPSEIKAVAEFEKKVLAEWKAPVKDKYLIIRGTGRAFGAKRNDGKRMHAAIDYFAEKGTPVYAMQAGTVINYSPNFYYGTQAVTVQHKDGSIALYGEISSKLRTGDKVKQGQKLGTMIPNQLDGGTMLHLELYLGRIGDSPMEGSLTNHNNKKYFYVSGTNYKRRADLLNPEFLLKLK